MIPITDDVTIDIFFKWMTVYLLNIKIDDYGLALQVLHTHLSVVVMRHCTKSQLKPIMWFIIFQGRVHYFF